MRYLSPFSLPDRPSLDPPDKKALQLQKRKLLAELDLTADGQLDLNGRPYSKNDILEYFDSLQDDTVLQYHAQVAKDKVLVDFLESGHPIPDGYFIGVQEQRIMDGETGEPLGIDENAEPVPYLQDAEDEYPEDYYEEQALAGPYTDPAFLEWLSPYFYTAFTEFLGDCLQQHSSQGFRAALQNRHLLTDYDQNRAWIQLRGVLENQTDQLAAILEQAEQQKTLPPIHEVSWLITADFITMIRTLPAGPFTESRHRLAFVIRQLAIYTFNKERDNRSTTITWMENARLLAVTEEVHEDLSAKLDEMEKLSKKADRGMIRAAIVLGIILLKFLVFQPSTPTGPIKFNSITIIDGKDTVTATDYHTVDSLLRRRKLLDSSIHWRPIDTNIHFTVQ